MLDLFLSDTDTDPFIALNDGVLPPAGDDDGDVVSCPTRLSLSFALGPL